MSPSPFPLRFYLSIQGRPVCAPVPTMNAGRASIERVTHFGDVVMSRWRCDQSGGWLHVRSFGPYQPGTSVRMVTRSLRDACHTGPLRVRDSVTYLLEATTLKQQIAHTLEQEPGGGSAEDEAVEHSLKLNRPE